MPSIARGRSLATAAPGDRVGDESFPSTAHQPPGLTLGTYPGCTPRPRNLPEYQAACRASAGDPVREYQACDVVEGMRVYQAGRFLEVINTDRHDPYGDVELRMAGYGIVATRVAPVTAPVYVLAPASDACHAPDAGAPGRESTAVGHG